MNETKTVKINLVTLILIILLIIAIIIGTIFVIKSDKFHELINNTKQTVKNIGEKDETAINYKEYTANTYKILMYDTGEVTALVNENIKLWETELDINSTNEAEQEIASKRDTIMHNIVQEREIQCSTKITDIYTLSSTEKNNGIQDAKVIVKCEDGTYHYIDLVAEEIYGTTTNEIAEFDTIVGQSIQNFEIKKERIKEYSSTHIYNFIYAVNENNEETLVYMY